MDKFRCSGAFSSMELLHLNAVRLYLHAATLSDLVTANGRHITEFTYWAQGRCSFPRQSRFTWIRQPEITPYQEKLWQQALHKVFLPYRCKDNSALSRQLASPLGEWTAEPNQLWQYYSNPHTESLESPVSAYYAQSYGILPTQSRHRYCFSCTFTIVPFCKGGIPADTIERDPADKFFTAQFCYKQSYYRAPPRPVSTSPTTLKDYINALPPERRRFFAWCRPCGNGALETALWSIREAIQSRPKTRHSTGQRAKQPASLLWCRPCTWPYQNYGKGQVQLMEILHFEFKTVKIGWLCCKPGNVIYATSSCDGKSVYSNLDRQLKELDARFPTC